jgi:hypothetical protein
LNILYEDSLELGDNNINWMLYLIKIDPDLGKDRMKHSADLTHWCPEIFDVF